MIYTIPSLPVLTSLHPERYLRTLLAVFLCSLLPIFAANLYINYVELRQDVSRINFEASLWQQKTRGLACVSHQGPYVFHQGQRPFKRLRLESELKKKNPTVNTVIFGSSTIKGIQESMLPKGQRLYNFSQSDNVYGALVSEIDLLSQYKEITCFIVAIDWSVGALLRRDLPSYDDIWGGQEIPPLPSWDSLMRDALSLSRVNMLADTIKNCIFEKKTLLLRKKFNLEKEEYLCKNGEVAKDFASWCPGKCYGFASDGSQDLSLSFPQLTSAKNRDLLHMGNISTSCCITSLRSLNGKLPQNLFDRFSAVIKKIKARNADIFFILPPLLPGLEKKILTTPEGKILRQLKAALHEFASENQVQILDAGQSENYGCHFSEFIDDHHPLPACYKKIMTHFYKQREKGKYGLISLSVR